MTSTSLRRWRSRPPWTSRATISRWACPGVLHPVLDEAPQRGQVFGGDSRPRLQIFRYFDGQGRECEVPLETGTLAFTYCQVPVVYRRSDERKIGLHLADGSARTVDGWTLDRESSAELFRRSGAIERIEVWLRPGL